MPYLSGGSLQDKLSQAPFSVSDVVTYGAQIADALEYAHGQGIVHRDITAATCCSTPMGARTGGLWSGEDLRQLAPPGGTRGRPDAGTPEYMAPEQIKGRPTRARSLRSWRGDVPLLTGQLPFNGSSSNSVMEGHHRLAQPPRQINPKVTPAVDESSEGARRDPRDRFQSARES
jgi:serine/threonine-protein kinase